MDSSIYITANCIIANNTVYKNGQPIFQQPASQPDELLVAAYQHFEIKYSKFYKMDSLCRLGWLAAELLLKGSFNNSLYDPSMVGVVLSNANASLDTDSRYFETTADIPSPALFVYTLPNIVTGEICIRHHIKGENAFFITESFDAGLVQSYVSNLFDTGILQCCICGWVELLGTEYKTALFLIEKNNRENSLLFTETNLNNLYQLTDG